MSPSKSGGRAAREETIAREAAQGRIKGDHLAGHIPTLGSTFYRMVLPHHRSGAWSECIHAVSAAKSNRDRSETVSSRAGNQRRFSPVPPFCSLLFPGLGRLVKCTGVGKALNGSAGTPGAQLLGLLLKRIGSFPEDPSVDTNLTYHHPEGARHLDHLRCKQSMIGC